MGTVFSAWCADALKLHSAVLANKMICGFRIHLAVMSFPPQHTAFVRAEYAWFVAAHNCHGFTAVFAQVGFFYRYRPQLIALAI